MSGDSASRPEALGQCDEGSYCCDGNRTQSGCCDMMKFTPINKPYYSVPGDGSPAPPQAAVKVASLVVSSTGGIGSTVPSTTQSGNSISTLVVTQLPSSTLPPNADSNAAHNRYLDIRTIVPAVVAPVTFLAILAAITFFCLRRRRRRRRQQMETAASEGTSTTLNTDRTSTTRGTVPPYKEKEDLLAKSIRSPHPAYNSSKKDPDAELASPDAHNRSWLFIDQQKEAVELPTEAAQMKGPSDESDPRHSKRRIELAAGG